jgi:ribosomal protein S15P/S13E
MISGSRLVRLDQHFDQRPVTLLSTQALICFVQQASVLLQYIEKK